MKVMQGEVVLNIPVEKAWKIYRDNEIISKVNPDMLAGAEYLDGDGSPGSLRIFRLGPAVHDYVKQSVQKIEKVEEGESVTYRVVQGELSDMYDPYIVTFSFSSIPGREEERCVAQWKAEYEPVTSDMPLPEQARDVALEFLADFENFQS
ncbi:hypothetical protein ACHQM5_003193 [Ranunculus cassubicifolius]